MQKSDTGWIEPIVTSEDLDYSSSRPLYRQLADVLMRRVSEMDSGMALPTEESLMRSLDLSRTTVRRAYEELEANNLVSRRAGKGTFVKTRRIHFSFTGSQSFKEAVEKIGMTPTREVVSLRRGRPTKVEADRLVIDADTPVWHITRVEKADGKPVALSNITIPEKVLPGLTKEELEGSLMGLLNERTGNRATQVREIFGTCTLNRAEAKHLGSNTGVSAFRVERMTGDGEGHIWEYSVWVAPGLTSRFEIVLEYRPGEGDDDPL